MSSIAVIVLGMHRSGTSLTARVINISGAYLGEDQALLAGDISNPTGYWENAKFLEFNEAIFKRFCGAWYAPPLFPKDWLADPAIVELSNIARKSIDQEFAGYPIWAWKEPRTTVVLPFWKQIVSDAKYVICVRNPLDVAASLETRNHFTLKRSIALWHAYSLNAFLHAEHDRTSVVMYEDLLREPRRTAQKILGELGLLGGMDERKWAEIDNFVDVGLEHHHHTLDDVIACTDISASARELYTQIVAGDKSSMFDAAKSQGRDKFDHLCEVLSNHADAAEQVSQLTRNLRETERKLKTMTDDYNGLAERAQHYENTLNTRSHKAATAFSRILSRLRR